MSWSNSRTAEFQQSVTANASTFYFLINYYFFFFKHFFVERHMPAETVINSFFSLPDSISRQMFASTDPKMSQIARQINVMRHSVRQNVWQDVRLSDKFLRQTNNKTHYNAVTQAEDSRTTFLTGQLVQLHRFFCVSETHPPPPVTHCRSIVLIQMGWWSTSNILLKKKSPQKRFASWWVLWSFLLK